MPETSQIIGLKPTAKKSDGKFDSPVGEFVKDDFFKKYDEFVKKDSEFKNLFSKPLLGPYHLVHLFVYRPPEQAIKNILKMDEVSSFVEKYTVQTSVGKVLQVSGMPDTLPLTQGDFVYVGDSVRMVYENKDYLQYLHKEEVQQYRNVDLKPQPRRSALWEKREVYGVSLDMTIVYGSKDPVDTLLLSVSEIVCQVDPQVVRQYLLTGRLA